jgi:hypothetical protein
VQLKWRQYFSFGRAELYPDMVAAPVCRAFGWDWHTYQNQPAWFITVILAMLEQEAEESKRRNKS